MNTTFTSKVCKAFAYGTLALGLVSGSAALAQRPTLTADIPFAFESGNQHFPAGKYHVVLESQQTLRLKNMAGGTERTIFTIPESHILPSQSSKIVFHRYGHEYFLSQVWTAGQTTGSALVKSRREKEAQVSLASLPQPEVTVALVHLPW